jgi:Haem-binding domain
MIKKIALYLALFLVAIQLIPNGHEVPKVEAQKQFFAQHPAPEAVQTLIKNACLDCHSYQTQYPWYGQVAPMSWGVNQHVNDGRKRLNFDDWQAFNPDQQRHAIAQSIATLENGSMPMPSYISYHPAANLSKAQRQQLVDFFTAIQAKTLTPAQP